MAHRVITKLYGGTIVFISLRIRKRSLVSFAIALLLCLAAVPLFALQGAANETGTMGKTVYLTFDDGPSRYTDELLDLLKAQNVNVTFFVCGQDTAYFDCIGRAAQDGHLIALHSNTHKFSQIYANTDAFWADIDALDALVFAQTGVHSTYLRFPGGSSNTVCFRYGGSHIMNSLIEQCAERGITYVDWNIDTKDAEGSAKSASYIVNRVVKGARNVPGDLIILMHDGAMNKTVTEATAALIERLRADGCAFDTLDHLSEAVHHNLP